MNGRKISRIRYPLSGNTEIRYQNIPGFERLKIHLENFIYICHGTLCERGIAMEINGVTIDNTFPEAFPAWVTSVIITAATKELAYRSAVEATGFGTSVIACPAEAGIDQYVPPRGHLTGGPGSGFSSSTRARRN